MKEKTDQIGQNRRPTRRLKIHSESLSRAFGQKSKSNLKEQRCSRYKDVDTTIGHLSAKN